MAITESLPGVKITIWSNGQKLKEQKRKVELSRSNRDRTVSKFIKSTTDAEFSFKIRVSKSYKLDCPDLVFSVYVDGKSMGGTLCGQYELLHGKWIKEIEGVKQPTEKRHIAGLRKFRFSKVVTDENSDFEKIAKDKLSTRHIGELQVQVHRCSAFHALRRGPIDVVTDLPTISEKALKGREVSHGTIYAATNRVLETANLYDVMYVDGENKPLAVYNFSYRSEELLEKELAKQGQEAQGEQEGRPTSKHARSKEIEAKDESGVKRRCVQSVEDDPTYEFGSNSLFIIADTPIQTAAGISRNSGSSMVIMVEDD